MAVVYPQRSTSGGDCLLWSPEDVTIRFLEAVAVADPDVAERLLSPDVAFWFGASSAPLRRTEVMRRLRRMAGSTSGFDVMIHRIRRYESTVWTDRTDAISRGRMHVQVHVRGVAEVSGGKIVDWHDEVRWVDLVCAVARGLIGVVVPSARAHMPLE